MESTEIPVSAPTDTPPVPTSTPTPTEPPNETIIYTTVLEVWEADGDSFSIGGRRFFFASHNLKVGDLCRITITPLHQHDRNT
jgi:hypothetical protein